MKKKHDLTIQKISKKDNTNINTSLDVSIEPSNDLDSGIQRSFEPDSYDEKSPLNLNKISEISEDESKHPRYPLLKR